MRRFFVAKRRRPKSEPFLPGDAETDMSLGVVPNSVTASRIYVDQSLAEEANKRLATK